MTITGSQSNGLPTDTRDEMAKRGKIQIQGTSPIFRISKPGYDVDTAPREGFLLHEEDLYSQPFHWAFVPCPFAGYNGAAAQDSVVTITHPNPGNTARILMYPVASDGQIVFPGPKGRQFGNASNGFPGLENWTIYYQQPNNAQIAIRFRKNPSSRTSPLGAYVVLFRMAN